MINNNHVEAVRQWHDKFLIKTITQPNEISAFLDLRTRIMEEEINEYFDAKEDMIARADAITDVYFIAHGTLALYEDADKKLRSVMAGYINGTFLLHCRILRHFMGLEENKLITEKIDGLFEEVLRSNHTKADADGNPIFREDGKLIKSDLFEEPNLRKVLFY